MAERLIAGGKQVGVGSVNFLTDSLNLNSRDKNFEFLFEFRQKLLDLRFYRKLSIESKPDSLRSTQPPTSVTLPMNHLPKSIFTHVNFYSPIAAPVPSS